MKKLIFALQVGLVAACAIAIVALAGGIIFTALTGGLAPWLAWLSKYMVNYW